MLSFLVLIFILLSINNFIMAFDVNKFQGYFLSPTMCISATINAECCRWTSANSRFWYDLIAKCMGYLICISFIACQKFTSSVCYLTRKEYLSSNISIRGSAMEIKRPCSTHIPPLSSVYALTYPTILFFTNSHRLPASYGTAILFFNINTRCHKQNGFIWVVFHF